MEPTPGAFGDPGAGGDGLQFPQFTGPLIGVPALNPLNGYFAGGGAGGGSGYPSTPGGSSGGRGGGGPSGPTSTGPKNGVAGTTNSGGGGGGGKGQGGQGCYCRWCWWSWYCCCKVFCVIKWNLIKLFLTYFSYKRRMQSVLMPIMWHNIFTFLKIKQPNQYLPIKRF